MSQAGALMIWARPSLSPFAGWCRLAELDVRFWFNIPACGPLMLAMLASVAVHGASGAAITIGLLSLTLFGLAGSLPLVATLLSAPAPAPHARLSTGSAPNRAKRPLLQVSVFIVLGLRAIGFGPFVTIGDPISG